MLYFLSVNYHSADLLRDLLHSIEAQETIAPYKIIIVNNAPSDADVYKLPQLFESVAVLTAKENLGFGGGCNVGFNYIYERDPQAYVWLINPDALLVEGAIATVQSCFSNHANLSILGTRIRASEQDIWFAQGRFNRWTGAIKHRLPENALTDLTLSTKVLASQWVSGCSMIFNLSRFDSPPRFDLNFFLDYEDVEICERYRQQGHTVGVTQAILVNHAVSAITHRNRQAKFRHATFSKLYFLHKHGTLLSLWLNLAYLLAWSFKLLLTDTETGLGRLQGWGDFVGWWVRSLTRQLPPVPFRPKTAFTQAQ